jgi:hypothetical protein
MPSTGEKPGAGTYMCTICEDTVTLDDPNDKLPSCPMCGNTEFEKIS